MHQHQQKAISWRLLLFVITALPTAAATDTLRYQPLQSWQHLRHTNLVRQEFDYSCGAAALATLLSHGLGDPTSERDVLGNLFDLLPEAEVGTRKREGFSLRDLQRVAQTRGYNAQGFRLQGSHLAALTQPVIVLIEPRGYKHFAVLRGVAGDRVYLADPARGNIRMPAYQFLESWAGADGTGIVFAVQAQHKRPSATADLDVPASQLSQPELAAVRGHLAAASVPVQPPVLSR